MPFLATRLKKCYHYNSWNINIYNSKEELKQLDDITITNKEIIESIGFELAQTDSYIKIAVAKLLKTAGVTEITYEQFGILFVLSNEDGLYQRQLAFLLNKDRPNITRMLDILEKKGYVKRVKDPDNKRISKVYLTPAGLEKAELMAPYKKGFHQKIHQGISGEDLDICRSVLRRIRDNLEDSCSQQI